ncbi:hypothetical protein [Bradyrhizobium elkanii]|uniref:Uncharacterized protein n=1 Tax=Bradyrhizobium elkanii TaxID=29448 RepID=A0ABV4FAF7_BRAEL|nr:hypothetical protein [Bradyrhizobium elkanii]MCP1752028.1 hypothetical protein [Bradyrhizobium elkanii]MCP1977799.1 hypothetical protein [Bradyrhizobium elkanii]MCS3887683.1 hypothetical protein [Bradyrhizobium elkanii]MCS4213298.1 hypothetical protein [Bradyrhizobium elkanii]MCW2213604.1 hypothetical protein [Bradyrhizobium elkanii]
MVQLVTADQVSELFAQIVENPGAAKPLLQKFEPFCDQELLDLFRAMKETLVPRVNDW